MSDLKDEKQEEEKIYGGCEGPDAMYVKLISSDGHEFIVKREHALTSGTIKAMLSGPGKFSSLTIKYTFQIFDQFREAWVKSHVILLARDHSCFFFYFHCFVLFSIIQSSVYLSRKLRFCTDKMLYPILYGIP